MVRRKHFVTSSRSTTISRAIISRQHTPRRRQPPRAPDTDARHLLRRITTTDQVTIRTTGDRVSSSTAARDITDLDFTDTAATIADTGGEGSYCPDVTNGLKSVL